MEEFPLKSPEENHRANKGASGENMPCRWQKQRTRAHLAEHLLSRLNKPLRPDDRTSQHRSHHPKVLVEMVGQEMEEDEAGEEVEEMAGLGEEVQGMQVIPTSPEKMTKVMTTISAQRAITTTMRTAFPIAEE
jgi:hypothetical protein